MIRRPPRDTLTDPLFPYPTPSQTKLVERMKLLAKAVFGETVLLGEDIIVGSAHDAGDRRILREPFALHPQFQRAVAAPAGRYLIPAGFLAVGPQQQPARTEERGVGTAGFRQCRSRESPFL